MDDDIPDQDPARLRDETGHAGRLLLHAEAGFRRDLDEPKAFRRLSRARRRRAGATWGLAAAALVALSWVGLQARGDRSPSLALSREPVARGAVPLVSAAPGAFAAVSGPSASLASVVPLAPAMKAPPPPSATPSEEACKGLLASNKLGQAVDCFRSRSHAAGLEGEVALYETARLCADRLRDAGRALALLDEHRSRFPNGALRGEADWLRVQSLERSGRFEHALRESEALLGTATGRTLASELHLLRARIQADNLGDCEHAASELVALVGEPGARGDEAELRRAACLEKLGRTDDAVSAYTHYLARTEPKAPERARERLAALRR